MENGKQHTSSIISKYGDTKNVKKDVATLNEILARQGTSLFLDVIAEHVGRVAFKHKFHSSDVAMTKISLVDELENAINERIKK